jgi:molybdopterin-guanine dinucleotide biosynthesis adapter protein
MRIFGIVGWKNAGKTSLVERLVADITARGLTVSTVKHVHHDVDLDQPGKDTFRHRQAGAAEVVLAGARRFAILHEHRTDEPPLAAILARLAPVDLVLVEGYKRDTHPKIEVFRSGEGRTPLFPGDPTIRAVATDTPDVLPHGPPMLDLNDTPAVADFILRATGLVPDTPFDRVIVVDWSSASSPTPARPSRDAIWIGTADAGGETAAYFRTRHAAEAALTAALDLQGRSLIGFDFPMGYPAGFAARLTGQAHTPAVWDWLAQRITDDAANQNNRFTVAAAINAAMPPGPFWGRPAGLNLPGLPPTKTADYGALGLPERRAVETVIRRAQPLWKLYTTGAVGAQALVGLPLIHRLSRHPDVAVWPFQHPTTARVVLAEVYPSLLASAVAASADPIPDRAQVTLLARALWCLNISGTLGPQFDAPPAAQEEGWILGANDPAALARALTADLG